jgi:hypothetical protein
VRRRIPQRQFILIYSLRKGALLLLFDEESREPHGSVLYARVSVDPGASVRGVRGVCTPVSACGSAEGQCESEYIEEQAVLVRR